MIYWALFDELALCDPSPLEPVADDGGAANRTRQRVPQEAEAAR